MRESKLLKKIKHLHQQFQHSARAPEQRTKTLATLRAIIEGMEDAGIKLPHN